MTSPALPEARLCTPHQRRATGTCARCGAFMCATCAGVDPSSRRCSSCYDLEAPLDARKKSARTLAQTSWATFVVMLCALGFGSFQKVSPSALAIVQQVLCLFGLGFGIAALIKRRGTGAPGVVAPAVVGIVLNALPVMAFLAGLIAGTLRHR